MHVLEQLFASLRRAGILRSQRGVRGGYAFARAAEEVTVLQVVECVDGPLRPAEPAVEAPTERLWEEARTMLADLLEGTSIADLAEREARVAGTMMFHI